MFDRMTNHTYDLFCFSTLSFEEFNLVIFGKINCTFKGFDGVKYSPA